MIIAPLDRKKVRQSVLRALASEKKREAQRKEWLKDATPTQVMADEAYAFHEANRRRQIGYRLVESVQKADGLFYLCYGGDYTDGTGGFPTREEADGFFYGGGR